MFHLLQLEVSWTRALRREKETKNAELTEVQEDEGEAADLVEGVGLLFI